jgi:hypothetical protein
MNMTDRNEESLSTRDLASPTDSQGGATTAAPESEGLTEERAGGATAPSADMPVEPADVTSDAGNAPPDDVAAESGAVGSQRGASAGSRDQVEAARGQEDRPQEAADDTDDARTPATSAAAPGSAAPTNEPLLPGELTEDFQRRWEEVQTRFVDEPRGAVEQADGLVAKLMQQLAESFAQERERLEAQWGRGEDISTEDLRVALQRYRSFFQRLLST